MESLVALTQWLSPNQPGVEAGTKLHALRRNLQMRVMG